MTYLVLRMKHEQIQISDIGTYLLVPAIYRGITNNITMADPENQLPGGDSMGRPNEGGF